MDLNTVTDIARPRGRADLPAWGAGAAFRQIALSPLGRSGALLIGALSAYGSAGTVVAGRASQLACEALREQILDFAVEYAGGARVAWSLVDGAVSRPGKRVGLAELAAAACAKGQRLAAMGRSEVRRVPLRSTFRHSASPSTNTPARSRSYAASTRRMLVASSIQCNAEGRSKAAWHNRSARPSTRKW